VDRLPEPLAGKDFGQAAKKSKTYSRSGVQLSVSDLPAFGAKATPEEMIMPRFDAALDALDWLFATKVCGTVFKHILSVAKAGHTLHRIQNPAPSDGSAASMASAWQDFQAYMGLHLAHALLESGEWREVCPTPAGAPAAPPMDDVLTVWSNTKGQRVVAKNKGGHYLFVVR
jgi:hypothetical protein